MRVETVVITGASAGVGRAVARRFARDKARIALIARGRDGLEATAREIEAAGGVALVLPCDVADGAAVEAAAARAEAELGPIDIWINVAFAGILAPFTDIDPADYARATDVTYMGQVHGVRAALKHMLPRDRGHIVLTGSALAYRGIPLQTAYCAAKHAIQGFQDSLRAELFHAKSRVHVAMVQLPGVNTPQFDWIKTDMPRRPRPASPPYQPEIAAEAIHYAAHHRRKQILVGAPTVMAIWGDRLASSLLDRYLGATGIAGQQDKARVVPDRQDNLWRPVPGDHGAHGRFDREARRHSPQLWLTTHRGVAATAAAALAGAGLALLARRRSAA
ncbi:SDR family oxidoreductase [Sphingomonas morindae]|uniref:SDR family oxidoreductase n=1 Tax=Sphingomonas morindae TaxID=1541170 RepID=A0ABY4X6I6_9SPHN|nr:SDR family oxidoreductase [Sphingomonas morindae]USI72539.1 SDR family oxidoreductase [Sphingomonas morindae]